MRSGRNVLASCNPSAADPVYRLKVAECRGYVIGIADSFDCNEASLGFTWNSVTAASQRDLVDHVITWLRAHPDSLGYQANGLVSAALAEAFPCSQSTAGGLDLQD